MALNWIHGQVVSKRVWSEGLFTLGVQCSGVEFFEPGQFLQVGLQTPEKHLHRPYSVASPHGDVLEFFIVRVDGGALSPLLWDLQVGNPIDVSQRATGSFTLSHADPTQDLWLIGTGTGLAPYIAMLRASDIWEKYQSIFVVHGVRYAEDLAYTDEMETYKLRYPGRFAFAQVTSRTMVPGCLPGRVTSCFENGTLEAHLGASLISDRATVMLCGNPAMLDEMESDLEKRGFVRKKGHHPGNIIVERYW